MRALSSAVELLLVLRGIGARFVCLVRSGFFLSLACDTASVDPGTLLAAGLADGNGSAPILSMNEDG
jgi:hypothetical protein